VTVDLLGKIVERVDSEATFTGAFIRDVTKHVKAAEAYAAAR
jgi:hypothetical protein